MKNGKPKTTTKDKVTPISLEKNNELLLLKKIIKVLPGSIYWKDKNGVYLGCNDYMLQMVNMKSVVGKTDFEMPWFKEAHQLRQNDLKVMQSNSTLETEEDSTLANGQLINRANS